MGKKLITIWLCFLLIIPLAACTKKDVEAEKQVVKMDITVHLNAYGPVANEAIDAAMKRIDELEQIASTTIETSDVCKINNAAGKEYVKAHPEILYKRRKEISSYLKSFYRLPS